MADSLTTETYKMLLYIFGPAVIGKAKWACTAVISLLSKVLMVTDEAFIIMMILNYTEYWKVVAKRAHWNQPLVHQ
jgi:hypothetical protein